MKKQISTILYVMILTLFAATFVSCSDEDDSIYGSLTINGQVTDDQGNPIAGAVVTLHSTGIGEYSPTSTTAADGSYSFIQVKCTKSIYMSVEAEGYKTDGIALELQFPNAVPGISLGSATLIKNFSLQKQ